MKKADYNRIKQAFAEVSLFVAYNPNHESALFIGLSLLSDIISERKMRKMRKRADKLNNKKK